MNGLTDYITEQPWEDTITTWYVLVDDAYQRHYQQQGQRLRASGPEPQLTDSEVITISLIIEVFFQGHEEIGYAFVCQYLHALFPRLVDPDRFNVRRRNLVRVIEDIRRDWRDQLVDQHDKVRLVDSAPVTLMTYTRGNRCRTVVGEEYFGVVSSKKARFFGWRLHLTCTAEQLVDEWVVAPAAHHDNTVLPVLLEDARDLIVIGDKAYNDAEQEAELWQTRQITLMPLRKDNQHEQWPAEVRRALGRVRHRVETALSTLTTAFNINQPRGRSLAGYVVRIATCILAHTLSFLCG